MIDVETTMVGWIEAQFPALAGAEPLSGKHVDTTMPAVEGADLPFVRVSLVSTEPYDQFTDIATVDVDVFNGEDEREGFPYVSARDKAYDLAQAVHAKVQDWPPPRYNGSRVDRVYVVSAPTDTEWLDQEVRRFLATYQFTYRH